MTSPPPAYTGNVSGLVIGTGAFANDLFFSGTDSNLYMITLATMSTPASIQIIASGGSAGGYLATDPYDGSLFITQSDRVMRLAAPSGAGFAFAAGSSPPCRNPLPVSLLGLGAASAFSPAVVRPARVLLQKFRSSPPPPKPSASKPDGFFFPF